MVAIIKFGKSLRRTFHYNENKLENGNAQLLMAKNFSFDVFTNSAEKRFSFLEKVAGLNADVKLNSVHISLNFAPDEMLSDDKMNQIANAYMSKIGFGDQPFLVYRHHDSGHPHLHIVTTNIELDGKRIPTHNIGKGKSEPARKEIEEAFNLVRAEEHKAKVFELPPLDILKLQYGKGATKQGIVNVLDKVLKEYKFCSLGELNAILNLYNVKADQGGVESRIYKNNGLVFRITDPNGNGVSAPLKASLIYSKPTLKNLNKLFLKNEILRQPFKKQLISKLDFALMNTGISSLEKLEKALKRQGISITQRVNESGKIYGITYIDFKSKCIFNGSALGKNYGASGILEHLERNKLKLESSTNKLNSMLNKSNPPTENPGNSSPEHLNIDKETASEKSLLDLLMQHEYASQSVPFEWKRKKKKKKR